jgi:hypothetical protein
MGASLADRVLKRLIKRIKPTMKVRDAVNKVYGNGYFESHYKGADKELKGLLHREALAADGEESDDKKPTIQITIRS